MSSTFDTVATIIAETCDIPRETIKPESHAINDLGIDSLDFLDVAFALRLTRSAYQQAAGLAKTFFGETAIAAGWLDEIVLPDMVLSRAEEAAREFASLKQQAHAATKLRTRADALAAIRAGIDGMAAEFSV